MISAKVGYYVHSYILTSIFDRDVGQSRASRQQEKIIIIVCTWNVVHIIIRLTPCSIVAIHSRARNESRILRVLLVSVPTCNRSLINHNRRV